MFYVKCVGGGYSLCHRPTHFLIGCYDDPQTVMKKMRKLAKMNRKKFWKWIIKKGAKVVTNPTENHLVYNKQEKDEWAEKAWMQGTVALFEQFGITPYTEEIPVDLIREVKAEIQAEKDKKWREDMRKEKEMREKAKQEILEASRKEREKKTKCIKAPKIDFGFTGGAFDF